MATSANGLCCSCWRISVSRGGVIHQIGFGQRDHAAGGPEVTEDLQVLFGLGHPAVISGHHEQSEVHSAHAGYHVFHEILMPRHIDNA